MKPSEEDKEVGREEEKEEDNEEKEETEEQQQVPVELYTGPLDVVDCINIFDFDSTLFFTPDPVEGRIEYQQKTGNEIFLLTDPDYPFQL